MFGRSPKNFFFCLASLAPWRLIPEHAATKYAATKYAATKYAATKYAATAELADVRVGLAHICHELSHEQLDVPAQRRVLADG